MSTMNRVCESCGESFWQGRGRPAKRCKPCRGGDRYGPSHRAFRAGTVDQAVGKPCARCHQVMLAGQAVQLDHADDDPTRYLGYSHQRCNASAGAARGNRLRAAAYRAAKGLSPPAARWNRPRVAVEEHSCEAEGCHAQMAVCACGRHSRPW
jgi:hypothetical protein